MSAIGTEAWWLAAKGPEPLLEWLIQQGRLSERKARLFACGCVRLRWDRLADDRSRRAVQVAERQADGLVSPDEFNFAADDAYEAADEIESDPTWKAAHAIDPAPYTYIDSEFLHEVVRGRGNLEELDLLRHLVGNPFAPIAIPIHLPEAVVGLAEALYSGTDCAPALHDALLEAGLPDLADHFNEPEHPKGCAWLDLLLGKT